MRPTLPLLALLTPLLAGCLGGETPAAESPDALNATGVGPDGAPPAGGNATAARAVPIALEGSVPTHAYVCGYAAVFGVCTPAPGEWNNRVEVTESGELSAGALTLTWTPSGPASEEMYISFYGYNEDDFHEVGFVSGGSPLTLEIEPTTFDPSMEYVVYVGTRGQGVYALVAGAYANAAQEQAFSLAGELAFA